MSGETDSARGKHLSAKELLKNKGICSKAWNEWEESCRALPKLGANKQFEPNGSWLESKQIEKGLNSREFLLGIERVERSSQLSSAEWLPEQKRAKVTRKIGSEWANFGQETTANLYLIPEEALLLLETECLELIWEGVPLSIQQAYEVLIESEGSDCTLDEYRVYSQLTRLGYRLQRFYYEKSQLDRVSRSEEPVQRKKVIVNPENGLWMTGNHSEPLESSGNRPKPEIENDVREIVENMVIKINGNAEGSKIPEAKETLPVTSEDTNGEKPMERRAKNSKVEIIAEQTILSPITIVKDGIAASEHNATKWPGARIQRNVKLLPKRNDKLSHFTTSPENPNAPQAQSKYENAERTLDKRKGALPNAEPPKSKKSKHEVIELSDDEIEEIPRPMSRMEMLNCLPNIASQIFITENIPVRYVPRGIRPRSIYRYDTRKLRHMPGSDRSLRTNCEGARNGSTRNSCVANESSNRTNAIVPYHQDNRRRSSPMRQDYPGFNYPCNTSRSYSYNANQYSSSSVLMNVPGGFYMQHLSYGRGEGWHNPNRRWSSYQMNMFRNSAMMGFAMKSVFMQSFYQANFYQNRSFVNNQFHNRPRRYLLERPGGGCHPARFRGSGNPRNPQSPGTSRQAEDEEARRGTFGKVAGTSSWQELKQKWREAKTITIEDEESNYDGDASEIEVVDQTIKPLINAKNARTFPEIYERLRIVKSAPEKTVRRKKSDLKISYNVYSGTQHYRKSNPGLPMFHLAVTSRKENVFLQPIELNRLQQDGKGAPIMFAHVSSSSIAYIQPGIITLPNLV